MLKLLKSYAVRNNCLYIFIDGHLHIHAQSRARSRVVPLILFKILESNHHQFLEGELSLGHPFVNIICFLGFHSRKGLFFVSLQVLSAWITKWRGTFKPRSDNILKAHDRARQSIVHCMLLSLNSRRVFSSEFSKLTTRRAFFHRNF